MKRVAPIVVLTLLFSMSVFVAAAETTTVVVNENSIVRANEGTPPSNPWMLYTRTIDSTGEFVPGPGVPPLGNGSLDLATPAGGDKVWLFNYEYVDTSLSEIDAIGYSTYRTAGSLQQVASINIEVDYTGNGDYTVLVFEPVYNTAQGPVVDGVWQTWDAYNDGNAIWWSSKDITGVCAFDCFVTWNLILASNPDAVILGGFGVNQGSGNPGLQTAVDALALGVSGDTVTYDFEPLIGPPADKDECKNGGWQTFNNPTFKNQGECVSFVASDGKSGGKK